MAEEDVVQEQIIHYSDYLIVAGVLTVNIQRGFGVLTRTGVGTLRITLPAGKATPNSRCKIEFTNKEAGAFAVVRFEPTSTDLLKDFTILTAGGAPVDNIDGSIQLIRVYP